MLHVMHVIRYMRHVAAALPPPLPLSAPPPEASAPRPVGRPPAMPAPPPWLAPRRVSASHSQAPRSASLDVREQTPAASRAVLRPNQFAARSRVRSAACRTHAAARASKPRKSGSPPCRLTLHRKFCPSRRCTTSGACATLAASTSASAAPSRLRLTSIVSAEVALVSRRESAPRGSLNAPTMSDCSLWLHLAIPSTSIASTTPNGSSLPHATAAAIGQSYGSPFYSVPCVSSVGQSSVSSISATDPSSVSSVSAPETQCAKIKFSIR